MRLTALLFLWIVLLSGCRQGSTEATDPLVFLPEHTAVLLQIHHTDAFRSEFGNNALLEHLRGENTPTSIEEAMQEILPLDLGESAMVAFSAEADSITGWVAIFEEPGPVLPDSLGLESGQSAPPAWVLPDSTDLHTARAGNWRLVANDAGLLNQEIDVEERRISSLKKALRTANTQAAATLLYPRSPIHPLDIFLFGKVPDLPSAEEVSWSAFDLQMQSDALMVQGMEIRPDSLWDNRNLFRGSPVLPLEELMEVTPSGATALLGYSLNDPAVFLNNQRELTGRDNPQQALAESVEQLAVFERGGAPVLILKALNPENINEILRPFQDLGSEFQSAQVYRLESDAALKEAFQPLLNPYTAWQWYGRLGNNFIFAVTQEGLQNTISAINRKDTYSEDPTFQALREYLSEASTVLAVGTAPRQSEYLTGPASVLGLPPLVAQRLPDGYLYAGQLNSEKTYDLLEYQFRKSDNPSGSGRGVSEVLNLKLEGRLQAGPFFLKNHRTGTMDIAVQDDQNRFYLYSNSGSLFWKKVLPGPILGDVHQVDLFRNKRFQMAFSLPDRLMVLDRNGETVAPFPLEFESGLLGPLAVFDYENNLNYRLVVAEGSKIHMFNGQGRNVSGFKYRNAGSNVLGPAKHFRIGSRDYLVFRLEDGRLEIRNRVGDTRVRVRETFDFSQNEVFLYRNTFAFTDREGRLIAVDPAGRVSKTPMNLNADHGMFATAKTLSVMNDNIFQVKGNRAELELGVYTAPRMFYLNDIIYVSVTDIQSQKVFLFRSSANALPGFPVEGNGQPVMADIDNDRNPELAVKFRDSAVAVYRIQR